MPELKPHVTREVVVCSFCEGKGGSNLEQVIDLKLGITALVRKDCEYCEGRTKMIRDTTIQLYTLKHFGL